MERAPRRLGLPSLVAAFAALCLTTCTGPEGGTRSPVRRPPDRAGRMPMPADYFVENVGQLDNDDVLFYNRAGGMDIGFAEGAILVKVLSARREGRASPEGSGLAREWDPWTDSASRRVLPAAFSPSPAGRWGVSRGGRPPEPRGGVLLRITFDGANRVAPRPREEMPFRSHYFLTNDPARWRTSVRAWRGLVYEGLYDGVDLVLVPDARGLKYELHVQPGADLDRVALVYAGAEGLEIAADGEAVIRTQVGDVRDASPLAWEEGGGEVGCRFVLRGARAHGFACEGWDGSSRLVVDPIIYSTFLGARWRDAPTTIAVDDSGSAHVTGATWSWDFPTTPGAFDLSYNGGAKDAFVVKLDPTGAGLLYATFLGGDENDAGLGIAVDGPGNAWVAGWTLSAGFPATSGAFDASRDGPSDAFVVKLDPSGSSLLYATFLGGAAMEVAWGIAVDPRGDAFVAGITGAGFPVTPGAFDITHNGGQDAFVAKLDASGASLLYATLLGGASDDLARAIAVDGSGSAYITGLTSSTDLPITPGAFNPIPSGADAFVAKLDPAGAALIYCTYLGGTLGADGRDIAVDASGNAFVTGETFSDDFPTTPGAFDTSFNGHADAYVLKLDAAGASLVYSTFLGGSSWEKGSGITVDGSGHVHAVGETASDGFPTTAGAIDPSYNGYLDAYMVRLDEAGGGLEYSTFLGGSSNEREIRLAMDDSGSAYISGETSSDDFPTTPGAFDLANDGGPTDVFVAKITIPAPACPHSQGYWKNHAADWPVNSLDLGNEGYDQAELLELLRTPSRGDGSLILAKQLIAARLNVANGSEPGPVSGAMADADALYAALGVRLPCGVHASTLTGQQMVALARVLDDYNNNLLTPGCTP